MVDVQLLKKCNKCNYISKIENIYIDDRTSEEEFLVKEYKCRCGSIFTDREYINYVLDKNIFKGVEV